MLPGRKRGAHWLIVFCVLLSTLRPPKGGAVERGKKINLVLNVLTNNFELLKYTILYNKFSLLAMQQKKNYLKNVKYIFGRSRNVFYFMQL